ncbi:MAG: ferrous iron transport protein B [Magnetospirillum sp.]|nr:ferrous iron transport protein B [Magnetospirillum sp.]
MDVGSTIALVGRPNCGKTTLFNALTGERQWVGNWPGVTVEGVQGAFDHGGRHVAVVDLPGAYTLTGTRSLDEEVTAEYLAGRACGLVVNVVDAASLERSLYLTLQVMESQGRASFDPPSASGVPVVVALNRMDKARADGVAIDVDALSDALGCPVVPMAAATGEGMDAFKDAVLSALDGTVPVPSFPDYPPDLLRILRDRAQARGGDHPSARWSAIRALEDDSETEVDALALGAGRHAAAAAVAHAAVRRERAHRRTATDRLDAWLLHPWWGVIGFLAVMYLMFLWTIQLGGTLVDAFDGVAEALVQQLPVELLRGAGAPAWTALLAEGAGRGVRTVVSFIPLVGFLYAFLGFLEESGYMARAAVVMDRFMRRIGLPGKAFVPLVVGLGCNVPAVMASRTLEDADDRKATIAMTPFMSCGARLPVYALFAATFFPGSGENLVFGLYLVGIAVAVLTGFVLKRTLFGGTAPPLLVELPPYHRPRLGAVLRRGFGRVTSFVQDAGKVVVPVVMILTALNAVSVDFRIEANGAGANSLLAATARATTPVLAPIGIAPDNWPATVGLFTGVFAKEALVGTLTALYAAENGAAGEGEAALGVGGRLQAALATIPANVAALGDAVLDPLGLAKSGVGAANAADDTTRRALTNRFDGAWGAFAYLVFVLLYAPCIATVAAIRREAGMAWTVFVLGWSSAMGFAAATVAYQAATVMRHPLASAGWMTLVAVALGLAVLWLRRQGRRQTLPALPSSGCGGCRGCVTTAGGKGCH